MKVRLCPIGVLALALCLFLASCSPSSMETDGNVTIASKHFTENILLGEMYAQLIESHTDLKVTRKHDFGTTVICFAAMEQDEVDIYVEYTGTIYNEILGYEYSPDMTPEELYDLIKKEMNDVNGMKIYKTIGLNNSYALAMPRIKADALGIETMSDLSRHAPKLVFAANDLYYVRSNDGYYTMSEKYGMNFKSTVKMDNSLLYDAAAEEKVDVIVVYATDSLLPKYDMIILNDDKGMFPDYYALPMARSDVIEKYPELDAVLDLLAGRIDDERMQELNYMVDVENKNFEEVAKTFLTDCGLLNN